MARVIELDGEIRILDTNDTTRLRLDKSNSLTGVSTIQNLTDPVHPQDADTKAARDAAIAGSGGGPPSGTAGGDLAGTYPNPSLANAGGGAVGPVGDSATIPVITVDAKGRVTAVSTAVVSGGAPSGTAGGDLGGTYPNPTVTTAGDVSGRAGSQVIGAKKVVATMLGSGAALSGSVPIADGLGGASYGALTASQAGALPSTDDLSAIATANATAASVPMNSHKLTGLAAGSTNGDSLRFEQLPTALPPNGSAGGDLTGTYPNPTLTTAGPGATGPLGSATVTPIITIDAKGRVTALSSVTISGVAPSGSAGGDLTGTYPNPTLATAGGGAAGPTGSTSVIPVVTVDTKGRVTALTSATPTVDTIGGGTDITTNNVTSTKHGLAPKSPADATQFLNGATTNAYAQVKDSDLATTDITTNNVSTTKHGFAPKAPNDATKYLDGTGAFSVPAGGGGSSPTTTKGDLAGFSTVSARIPIGSDTQVLVADSAQTLGLKWAAPAVASVAGKTGTVTLVASDVSALANTSTLDSIATAHATAADISMNSHKLTSVTDPASAQDAATKNYVDTAINGLNWKAACRLASAAALPSNTYSNGSSGVGATLTGVGFGALTVDGVTVVVGDRILVKNEVTGANNGIYTVTVVGAVATLYVLTRATDYNQASELATGDATYINVGTANTDTSWTLTTTSAITIGTTALTFAQFGGNLVTSVATRTGAVTLAVADVSGAAPLASPTFTGTPAAPTAAVDTNTTQLATTAMVLAQAASATPIIDGTATVGTSTRYARGDHVHPTDTSRAALASPTLTGTPAAPTAAVDTNTTQIATTAMVLAQAASATPLAEAATAVVGTSTRFARGDHVHPSLLTTKGDLLAFSTVPLRVPVGSDNQILIANSAASGGVSWANKTGDMLKSTYDAGNISQQLVGISATQTITNKWLQPRVSTTTSSATPTINTDSVDYFELTALAANITSMTTNLSGTPIRGQQLMVVMTDTGSAKTISWGTKFEDGAATLPTTTVGSTILFVLFWWNVATTKWRCMASG